MQALIELCTRRAPLSLGEARRLRSEDVLCIGSARDIIRQTNATVGPSVQEVISQVFSTKIDNIAFMRSSPVSGEQLSVGEVTQLVQRGGHLL